MSNLGQGIKQFFALYWRWLLLLAGVLILGGLVVCFLADYDRKTSDLVKLDDVTVDGVTIRVWQPTFLSRDPGDPRRPVFMQITGIISTAVADSYAVTLIHDQRIFVTNAQGDEMLPQVVLKLDDPLQRTGTLYVQPIAPDEKVFSSLSMQLWNGVQIPLKPIEIESRGEALWRFHLLRFLREAGVPVSLAIVFVGWLLERRRQHHEDLIQEVSPEIDAIRASCEDDLFGAASRCMRLYEQCVQQNWPPSVRNKLNKLVKDLCEGEYLRRMLLQLNLSSKRGEVDASTTWKTLIGLHATAHSMSTARVSLRSDVSIHLQILEHLHSPNANQHWTCDQAIQSAKWLWDKYSSVAIKLVQRSVEDIERLWPEDKAKLKQAFGDFTLQTIKSDRHHYVMPSVWSSR